MISRRALFMTAGVVGGGVLVGAVSVGAWINGYNERAIQDAVLGERSAKLVAQWIQIAPDGHVTVLGPATEMGQGAQTSLLQIVLDELDADPTRTTYALCPADPAFSVHDALEGALIAEGSLDGWAEKFVHGMFGRMASLAQMQFTGGSTAVAFTGWKGMRRAAAGARMLLAQVGAERMKVPVSEVVTRDGAVHHEGSGQSMHYGELAEEVALMPLPEPVYKDRAEYKYIGTRYPRIDIPDKVFGRPIYGIDEQVEGMRYAAVAPPPLASGTIASVSNQAAVRKMRGVEAIVERETFVAVVADNPWRAEQAVRKLALTGTPGPLGQLDTPTLRADRLAQTKAAANVLLGEAEVPLEGADLVEATYETPHYAHVPMEPMNCTVWEDGGKHHVAAGVQGMLSARNAAVGALGRDFDDVVLHPRSIGGGFGRRNGLMPEALTFVTQACEVQKEVGGAVKLTWSREAELRMSPFHQANVGVMQAKLGGDGLPTDWTMRIYTPLALASEAEHPYDKVGNYTVSSANGEPAVPYCVWRSVDKFNLVHFIEGFVDELAEAAGQDPVAYRMALLEPGSRKARVLARVAEMSGWKGSKVGDKGYGVAFAEAFGSLVAMVAEVSIDEKKEPKVHQVWCAVDTGTPVNPGSVEAQTQGAVFWGLSATLYDGLFFRDGEIVQSNFHSYRVATLRDATKVHVDVMVSPDAPVGGAGETATPLVAPAVSNAIAALADRPRSLPIVSRFA